ncbi:MAG: septal ring lytic transglycosylase RlpA family protein [Rhodopila sp.]|jgi:rare lipoprotein A
MTKYFVAAFVAIYSLLGGSHGAVARTPSENLEPQNDTSGWVGEAGKASYYGPGFHGRQSASGVRFNQNLLTAAHPWLPFGTKVRVRLASSDRSVIVTITDRIYSKRRILDLSVAAARELGMIHRGVAQVTLAPA